jgi:uncharacterized protein YcfL
MIRLCLLALNASTLLGCSMSQEEISALGQSLQQSSSQLNASSQQMLNSSSQYRAQQPMMGNPYQSNGVRCINTGIYTSCR